MLNLVSSSEMYDTLLYWQEDSRMTCRRSALKVKILRIIIITQ